jgi:uncharacterized protein YuzE
MKMTYDQQGDVAYIKLTDGPVAESEEVAPGVVLDFDAEGRVLAVEFLPASKVLAPGVLAHLPVAVE